MLRFNIKDIVTKNWLLIGIFMIATFLRFFRLFEFTTFLNDQGRDAIVMKRLITFEHLTSIGPPSSIGGVFLGPFFYYLISPFLLLFNFNPEGMAFGVALLSVIGLGVSFYIVYKELGQIIAIIFALLAAFSFVNIQLARFSWNPNLLPIFAFLTLYFFYKFLEEKKRAQIIYGILTGVFFGLSVQLHHLAFFLIPGMLVYLILNFKKNKFPSIASWIGLVVATIVTYSPLIIFDLRYNFLNTKSLIGLFTGGTIVAKGPQFTERIGQTFTSFFNHIFSINFPTILAVLLFIGILSWFIYLYRKNIVPKFIQLHAIMFFVFMVLFAFLNSERHPHYYGSIYYSFFVLAAYLLTTLPQKKRIFTLLIGVFLILYVALQMPKYYFLYRSEPDSQIKQARAIAQSIIDKHPQTPYQIAGLPFTESEEKVRYFLEVLGDRPLEMASNARAKQLFVVCHAKCQPLGDPQYQIAAFDHGKIVGSWKVYDVRIYKAVHTDEK